MKRSFAVPAPRFRGFNLLAIFKFWLWLRMVSLLVSFEKYWLAVIYYQKSYIISIVISNITKTLFRKYSEKLRKKLRHICLQWSDRNHSQKICNDKTAPTILKTQNTNTCSAEAVKICKYNNTRQVHILICLSTNSTL